MGIFNRFKKDKPEEILADKAKLDNEKKAEAKTAKPKKEEKKPVEKVKPVKKKSKKDDSDKDVQSNKRQQATRVLVRPIISEKASTLGTYNFMVAPTTNKNEVAKAFEAIYGKKPRKVNIINVKGKRVRFGRLTGKQSDWKKAIIYLNKDEVIDLFAE